MKDLLEILEKVANQLDSQKLPTLADRVDSILSRVAFETEYDPEKEEEALQKLPEEPSADPEEERQALRKHVPFSEWKESGESVHLENAELLIKHDIFPIDTPSDTADLGRGAYGQVYQAVCGPDMKSQCPGEVAVKVTISDQVDEGEKWRRIMEAAQEMPAELKKHLPQIYDIIETSEIRSDRRWSEAESRYYYITKEYPITMIVMEKLAPVPKDITRKMFGYNPLGQHDLKFQVKDVLQNPELRTRLAAELVSYLRELPAKYPELIPTLADLIETFVPTPGTSFRGISNDFSRHLLAGYDQLIDAVGMRDDDENYDIRFKNELMAQASAVFRIFAEVGGFPADAPSTRNWESYVGSFYEMPETQGLLQALEFLKQHGIQWSDLKGSNMMMRPSTGDLVLIDVGLYKVEGLSR